MKKVLKIVAAAVFSLFLSFTYYAMDSEAKSTDDEIQELKREVERLRDRIDELEKKEAEEEQVIEKMTKEMEVEERDTDSILQTMRRYVDRRIERFSIFPTSKLFISGYGDVRFIEPDEENSTFAARFAPILHYQLIDRVHFIVEPEFSLVDDELEIELEVGEIDFIINDYLTLVTGKFLLPFNVFSERLHPTWINKMPDPPILYGHAHGDEESAGIVPILSDLGIQLRGGAPLPLFAGSKIMYSAYLTNGPRIHAHEGVEEAEIEFGENFTDNNSNKAVGGRIGILPVWNLEFGASFLYGEASEDEDIDVLLIGFDGEYHYRGLELRGEFIRLEHDERDGEDWDVAETNGFYLQGAYRLSNITLANEIFQRHVNRLEPVIRYGEIFNEDEEDISQLALGLDYWFTPSYALKLAYQFNDGINDQFLIQLAFGF